MLNISVFEFIVRILPEALVFIFATYTFSNIKIDKKKYLLASVILGCCVFIIRKLPINYGVHTILNIFTLPIICTSINKISIVEATMSSIITTILLFVLEGVNVFFLSLIFKDSLTQVMSNPTLKTIYGLPSLAVLAIIVIGYYNYLGKKEKLNYV